jgi:hypothetical protein
MKTLMTRAPLMALAVAGLLGAGVRAASADETIVAKIPFPFVVRGMEMPAGDYTITRDPANLELIIISRTHGPSLTFVLTNPGDDDGSNAQPQLEFERVGKVVYLTQVTLGGGDVRDIPVPPASH